MKIRILLLFVSISLIGADKPTKKQAGPNPIASLQGTWSMVSMITKGVQSPPVVLRRFELVINDHQWTVTNGNIVSFRARILVDPSQSPRAINLYYLSGDKEALSQGIYSLEGDTMTVGRALNDGARPKEFKAAAESGYLVVWKKATQ